MSGPGGWAAWTLPGPVVTRLPSCLSTGSHSLQGLQVKTPQDPTGMRILHRLWILFGISISQIRKGHTYIQMKLLI